MFTGIVQTTVPIYFVEHSPTMMHYALQFSSNLLEGLRIGASVAVNGACQTVVAIKGDSVFFDAISETLRCTTVRTLTLGQLVNVERAAKIGDEIGGHLLSGHVIGTGVISKIETITEQRILTISCDPAWMKYILYKGYIAVNGVSLTVQESHQNGYFTVHLIPETLRITTFKTANTGEAVNIEIDSQTQAIVDTVEKVLKHDNCTKTRVGRH